MLMLFARSWTYSIVPKDINKLTYEYKKWNIMASKTNKKIDENYEIKYDINNPQRMLRFIDILFYWKKYWVF